MVPRLGGRYSYCSASGRLNKVGLFVAWFVSSAGVHGSLGTRPEYQEKARRQKDRDECHMNSNIDLLWYEQVVHGGNNDPLFILLDYGGRRHTVRISCQSLPS